VTFKPLLAATVKDVQALRFPLLASQKLDGIRATVQGGRLLSRTLKEIPNRYVQEMFADLPNGLDGELIVGDPIAPDAYRQTVSVVMSDDKPADGVRFYMFDWYGTEPSEFTLPPFLKRRFSSFRRRCSNAWRTDHSNCSCTNGIIR
jgi:ATP-dependent DNA ligase